MTASNHAWMIYGANGFTGRLIARRAVAAGMKPILAGRSQSEIESFARELDCPCRVFAISSADEMASQLTGLSALLLCAGPFSQTAEPVMKACLRARVNYLDITGELNVIELAAAQHQAATVARISVMPSVGFDVVPSDCLSAKLATLVPDPIKLELAFTAISRISRGTATTMFSQLGDGGRVRQNGQVIRVPIAWKSAEIPFPSRKRHAITIPWGDVSSAYYTTGIPNIEVYMAMPPKQIRLVQRWRWLLPVTKLSLIQSLGRKWIRKNMHGPNEQEQKSGRAEFWGRVTNRHGQTAEATLITPEGYSLTAQTALAIVERTLRGEVSPGFSTPAKAFGADFIQQFPGVQGPDVVDSR